MFTKSSGAFLILPYHVLLRVSQLYEGCFFFDNKSQIGLTYNILTSQHLLFFFHLFLRKFVSQERYTSQETEINDTQVQDTHVSKLVRLT